MSTPPGTEAVGSDRSQRHHLEVLLERLIGKTKDRLRAPRLSAITDEDGARLHRLTKLAEDASGDADPRASGTIGDANQ